MAIDSEAVLGSFYGDDAFPVEWNEGERDLLWILDDLHMPEPGVADVLRHRRLVADLRPHVPAVRHAVRVGLARQERQRLRVPRGRPGRCRARASSRASTRLATSPGCRAATGPAESAPTSAPFCRTTRRTSSTGGAIGSGPRSSATSPISTPLSTVTASLVELAVLLEDAIDIHDRHWKIHWMLNFAQFSATIGLNATIAEVKGEVDPALVGRLQSSVDDRNWDCDRGAVADEGGDQGRTPSCRARSRARPPVRCCARSRHPSAAAASSPNGSIRIARSSGTRRSGRTSSSIPTWRENPAPIIETIRGYLETDYDFPATLAAVQDDLDAAKRELLDDVPEGEGARAARAALDLSLRMNPLTPDHHFYIDQATNALRPAGLVAIGARSSRRGVLDDPEDVMFLRYNELRVLIGEPGGPRRAGRSSATGGTIASAASPSARPSGSARRRRRSSPSRTTRSGAFPRSSTGSSPSSPTTIHGLAGSPGVVEGTARLVGSLDEFDQVQDGRDPRLPDDEPGMGRAVHEDRRARHRCRGVASHPAVVAREFGTPGGRRHLRRDAADPTGDRVRVNGATGVVEVLEHAAVSRMKAPRLLLREHVKDMLLGADPERGVRARRAPRRDADRAGSSRRARRPCGRRSRPRDAPVRRVGAVSRSARARGLRDGARRDLPCPLRDRGGRRRARRPSGSTATSGAGTPPRGDGEGRGSGRSARAGAHGRRLPPRDRRCCGNSILLDVWQSLRIEAAR